MKSRKEVFDRLRNKVKKSDSFELPDNIADFIKTAKEDDLIKTFEENQQDFLDFSDYDNNSILHLAIEKTCDSFISAILTANPKMISKVNKLGETPLSFAISRGASIKTIKKLLKYESKEENLYEDRDTPLHIAVKNDRIDLIEILVASGFKIDAINDNKETALLTALSEKKDDIAVKLIKMGADTTICKYASVSPIHIAIQRDCKKSLELLLQNKDIIENLNEFKIQGYYNGYNRGATPFMVAVSSADFELVKKMVDLGVNINAKDNIGRNALHYAMDNTSKEEKDKIINFLLYKGIDICNGEDNIIINAVTSEIDNSVISSLIEAGANLNTKDSLGKNPIYYAIISNKLDILEILLKSEINVNAKVSRTEYAFDLTYKMSDKENSLKVFKLLREAGADIENINANDRTPLQEAAYTGNFKIVEYLLQQGALKETKSHDHRKMTAFLFSFAGINAREDRLSVAKLFKKYGADLNAKDDNGNNALHIAIENNFDLKAIEWLIKSGLDINAKNNDGKTPIDIAIDNQKTELLIYLIEQANKTVNTKDKEGKTLLHKAAESGKSFVVNKLLEETDIDINARDNDGKTPLMLASYNGHLEVMKSLVKGGARINILDKNGRTPLYYAVIKFLPAPVEFLLKEGANFSIVPKNDRKTMLHQAAEAELPTLVGYFLKAGIKVNRKDKDGNTALHIAVRFRNFEVAEYLLANGADTDVINKAGFSPLDIAINKNYTDLISLIKDYKKHRESGNKKPLPKRSTNYSNRIYRGNRYY